MSDAEVIVQVLEAEDWQRWRTIRLRSLRAAPDAFGSTWERESTFGPNDWTDRLEAGTAVTASIAGRDVGLGAGFCDEPSMMMIIAMFTDENWRGHGVASAVLRKLQQLAVERRRRPHLWVVEDNPAVDLYLKHGFAPDGQREPLRPGSRLIMQHMVGTAR